MRNKLIKKGQGGFALFSNQLMGQSSMNFSQEKQKYNFKAGLGVLKAPELDTTGLAMNGINAMNSQEEYNPFSFRKGIGMLNSYKKLSDPTKLSQPNFVKVMSGPDVSKITEQGISKLNAISKPTTNQVNSAKWNNFKEGAGEFLKSDSGKTMGSILGSGADAISANVGEGDRSIISSGLSMTGDALMRVNPLIGSGFKGLGLLNQATSKQINTNINSGIAGYSGSDINESKTFDGISRLLGNEKKYKGSLNQRKQIALSGKINTQDQLKQGQARAQTIGNTGIDNQKKLTGGLDFSVLTAKKGATLQDIRNYIKTRNIEKEVGQDPNLDENLTKSEIQKFQNGGSLIPSGALHKNKHKLESINPELDGEITKKGIPVISYAEKGDILEYEADGETPKVLAEGGEIIQHAEIEVGEIILNISLTKKLIELMKKDTSEAMIEAGKILARELMEDTTDNTGLLEKTIGNEN